MSYNDKLRQIDELQQQIAAQGKLPDEVLKKINYKFRLEWNYTSNSMEGNTLTKAETRSVMIGNITVEGKPIKDVLEVKGHDEVISNILKMGKNELNISEARIRDIHKGIMHEENPIKQLMIGHWKKQPNHVINYKGEKFEFTLPGDVPDKMHELMNWLNVEREKMQRHDKEALHPVTLALEFHLRYVTIHPFYDGNGRTCRILTNILLIAYGYPPIYIKEQERQPYMQYIADIQGYGGNPEVFYEFMSGLLLRSQQILLDAIEGKDIEEPDDIDKEIALWKRQRPGEKGNVITKSYEVIEQLYNTSFSPMLDRLHAKLHTSFYDMFNAWDVFGYVNGGNNNRQNKMQIDNFFRINILNGDFDEFGKPRIENMWLDFDLKGFNRDGLNTFNAYYRLEIQFGEFKYHVRNGRKTLLEKLYSQSLAEEEIQLIIADAQKTIFEEIKQRTNH